MIFKNYRKIMLAGVAALAMSGAQAADEVKIGVSLSATAAGASMGIPERQAVDLLPKTLGGLPVRYIVLDDATDPSTASKNARRLVEQENVDAIVGSTTVPTSLPISAVANESKTPHIALAPWNPKPEQMAWTFPLPQSIAVMAAPLFEDMKKKGVKRLAFIGFHGGYGDVWLNDVEPRAKKEDIELVAVERFDRNDKSVTGQTLKMLSARPDAVLVVAGGTPSVPPMRELKERGFKGQIYQTHGTANNDVLRLAGKTAEGMILPTGAVLVAENLADGHPSKPVAMEFLDQYEGKHGEGARNNFAAYAHDAYLVLDNAVAEARKSGAKPGTPEFRKALRDAIEATKSLPVTHGVITMSPTDHSGFDQRGAVLITVENGKWKMVE
jgi:branched-chain amino acid transport system substrate-binding protein